MTVNKRLNIDMGELAKKWGVKKKESQKPQEAFLKERQMQVANERFNWADKMANPNRGGFNSQELLPQFSK